MKKEEHALRMRLRNNLFAQFFPELDRLYERGGQPDDLILSIAEHSLDPKAIAALEFADFLKLIAKRKIRIEQEKRLRRFGRQREHQLAAKCTTLPDGRPKAW